MKMTKRSIVVAALMLGIASRGAQAAPFDQQFIDSMTPHHQSALMMAQMALTKAQLPEVKRLARSIIRDQNNEITLMKRWRKAWYPNAAMPMDHGSMAGMNHGAMSDGAMDDGAMNHSTGAMNHSTGAMKMSGDKMTMPGEMMGLPMKGEMDMGKLKSARGRDFDRMFLKMMIPHHAGAILMAQEALDVTGRPPIRALSYDIISSQAREIGLMQGILDRRFKRR